MWRSSYGEEQKMLQGFLLEDAKYETKNVWKENILGFIMIFIAVTITKPLFEFLQPVIIAKDIIALCIIGFMAFGIWYVAIRCMLTSIRNVKTNWVKQYYKTIVNNEFRVQDITIVEARHLYRLRNNLGGTVVKIKDLLGNVSEKEYVFKYWDTYQIGAGLFVEVPMGDGDIKQIVYPCKGESPSTWDKGLKLYAKYMN